MTGNDDLAGLSPRSAALDLSPEEFRTIGHRLVDEIAEFLGRLPALPVTFAAEPHAIRRLLPPDGPPVTGTAPAELIDEAWRLLATQSLFNGHPRFFGYITSSAAPIGALADLAAAAVNPNVGGWQLSPLASEIERQCVRWIASMLGFPAGDGLLVSGGNMANLVGFLAARTRGAGEGVRERGVAGRRLVVYAGDETHTWLNKAADLSGLGTDAIRWIPSDAGRRIDLSALARQLEADRRDDHRPLLVVGTAGSVATGAIDPLDELASLAAEHGAWFHVDGAYGAFARVVPELAPAFAGLERADSLAVDPHKWLYAPIEAGCLLVRDPQALEATFAYTPSYYRFAGEDAEEVVNYYRRGPQNSRGFRALKVWLGLRQAGLDGYRRMIGDDVRLARELSRVLGAEPEFDVGEQGLSIVTFRFVPADLRGRERDDEAYLNELNERLLTALQASGEIYLSNAIVDGRFLLRACICNFRTSLEDVRAVPGIVARHGRELHRARGRGKNR